MELIKTVRNTRERREDGRGQSFCAGIITKVHNIPSTPSPPSQHLPKYSQNITHHRYRRSTHTSFAFHLYITFFTFHSCVGSNLPHVSPMPMARLIPQRYNTTLPMPHFRRRLVHATIHHFGHRNRCIRRVRPWR